MKQFFGFKDETDAVRAFTKEYLEDPKWSSEIHERKVCDDATVWPQTFSTVGYTKQITTDKFIIKYVV